MIAGFPTEDEAMFERSLALVEEAGLDYLHVFPFSARPGTPAARMPQLSGTVVKARAARLRAAGTAATARALARRVDTIAQVLVEQVSDEGGGFGHSEHYAPVRFAGTGAVGSIVPVRVTAAAADGLLGQPV
jgi:threonylcarbamoyladenosine tRNA methylthiotransferase MtaB